MRQSDDPHEIAQTVLSNLISFISVLAVFTGDRSVHVHRIKSRNACCINDYNNGSGNMTLYYKSIGDIKVIKVSRGCQRVQSLVLNFRPITLLCITVE